MKYFRGTLAECEALIQRLDNFYGLPTEHTLTFGYAEQDDDKYILRIKDRHYDDLTDDEKSKVVEK